MVADRTGDSFVPMMVTRIILSLKKAASTPPKFEMVEFPTGFTPEFQDQKELQYGKGDGVFPHLAEHIQPPPGLNIA